MNNFFLQFRRLWVFSTLSSLALVTFSNRSLAPLFAASTRTPRHVSLYASRKSDHTAKSPPARDLFSCKHVWQPCRGARSRRRLWPVWVYTVNNKCSQYSDKALPHVITILQESVATAEAFHVHLCWRVQSKSLSGSIPTFYLSLLQARVLPMCMRISITRLCVQNFFVPHPLSLFHRCPRIPPKEVQ